MRRLLKRKQWEHFVEKQTMRTLCKTKQQWEPGTCITSIIIIKNICKSSKLWRSVKFINSWQSVLIVVFFTKCYHCWVSLLKKNQWEHFV
jgi:hypothetical protein